MSVIGAASLMFIERIAAEAERLDTPCGDGAMVWHRWGAGPPLVLLHGGYGSWMHWIRNVLPLSRRFTVFAPDLPGLGESATPPEPHTAEGLAAIIIAGLLRILPEGAGFHLAGFSFGGVLGGHVAAQAGTRLRGFTIVGSNGLGLPRERTNLLPRPRDGNEAAKLAVARHNVGALMIADPAKIDDLAVAIQYLNAPRGRVRSPRFSRTDTLARVLPQVAAPLSGIWGERDATAFPHLAARGEALRQIQPKARFEIIPAAGHWVQYEAADAFNPLLAELAGG